MQVFCLHESAVAYGRRVSKSRGGVDFEFSAKLVMPISWQPAGGFKSARVPTRGVEGLQRSAVLLAAAPHTLYGGVRQQHSGQHRLVGLPGVRVSLNFLFGPAVAVSVHAQRMEGVFASYVTRLREHLWRP